VGYFPGGSATACNRQPIAKGLRQKHSIAHVTFLDQPFELLTLTPGGFVEVVRRQENGTGCKRMRIAEDAHSLHRSS